MHILRPTLMITVVASFCVAAIAAAQVPDETRDRILKETLVVAVTDLPIPAAEYKGDNDPKTLEIVFLKRKKDGPSRISDDGEVIFLYKASDETQQKLISRSFEIRFARAASGT